jgi:hypothetical protein
MARKETVPKLDEATIQRQSTTLLHALGYTVMESGKSRSKQRCKTCGTTAYATGWQGNTVGLPDLYVHSINWPRGVALAIEMKTEKGVIRPEQLELANKGLINICRSTSCVLQVIEKYEESINNTIQVDRIRKIREINGI